MEHQFDDDYRKMYLKLFNAVTDAVVQLEKQNYGVAAQILKDAQTECEEIFIE